MLSFGFAERFCKTLRDNRRAIKFVLIGTAARYRISSSTSLILHYFYYFFKLRLMLFIISVICSIQFFVHKKCYVVC